MSSFQRWMFDTNTLVSRLLIPTSTPALALIKALHLGDLVVSDETMQELIEVLSRPKFDKYIDPAGKIQFLQMLGRISIRVEILRHIEACRDPKDNKFLSLAVNGKADALITGDNDLLELNPFMGIPVLTPSAFLKS